MTERSEESMGISKSRPSMGVLGLYGAGGKFRLDRYPATGPISPFIKHYWIVEWNLEGEQPHLQDVVPNPCANLVVEKGKTCFYGPAKERYTQRLEGRGVVFGAKFRPGGLYPYIKREMSECIVKPIDVVAVLGIQGSELEERVLAQSNDAGMVKVLDDCFAAKVPRYDENITLVNQIIDHMEGNREITKVEQLGQCFDISLRQLQRLFSKYVGVNPKSVIRLFRLQNAAEAMDLGQVTDLARLSVELGYHDQAHFSKDFKTVIGKTPERYLLEQTLRL
ncbi:MULTISPECIES: helix-turn-helix domain-containing protein [unclassified Paenibacillus]|uniref:AraC family transcriptional regulator n=1 Tax=unclassified Paenibacillus TaxID=185978 RepID=UPI001F17FDC6|nr:helix-turn-helix domain-containing protein [Paenibacillus sp. JJ-223]